LFIKSDKFYKRPLRFLISIAKLLTMFFALLTDLAYLISEKKTELAKDAKLAILAAMEKGLAIILTTRYSIENW
jgi:hypothetical protein